MNCIPEASSNFTSRKSCGRDMWPPCPANVTKSGRFDANPPAPAHSKNSTSQTAVLPYFKPMSLLEQMTQLAKQARAASRELAKLTTAEKNRCLLAMADALEKEGGALKQAND